MHWVMQITHKVTWKPSKQAMQHNCEMISLTFWMLDWKYRLCLLMCNQTFSQTHRTASVVSHRRQATHSFGRFVSVIRGFSTWSLSAHELFFCHFNLDQCDWQSAVCGKQSTSMWCLHAEGHAETCSPGLFHTNISRCLYFDRHIRSFCKVSVDVQSLTSHDESWVSTCSPHRKWAEQVSERAYVFKNELRYIQTEK